VAAAEPEIWDADAWLLIDESLLSGGPLTPPQSNPPAEEVPARRRKVQKAPRRVEGEDVTLYAYVERLRMYALEGHEEAAAMLWDWETVGSRGDAAAVLWDYAADGESA